MKRLVLATALAAGAVGCDPEINQDPVPAQRTLVLFEPSASPPIVPAPNDIAIDEATGKVNAPIDPNSSPAQQEFTRDYLNSLNGFPVTASASASVSNDLVPESVNPATVRVVPINAIAEAVYSPVAAPGKITPTIAYDANNRRITVSPNGAWPKGSRWAVAVLGGANGVQSADGSAVGESSTFTLLKSDTPIANCPAGADGQPDYKSTDCTLGTNLIPSNIIDDPEARFREQLAAAVRLEKLRAGYARVFAALATPQLGSVAKENVVLLWTWGTVAQPEATFDPANSVVPFPNNLLLSADGTRVNLPVPPPVDLPGGGQDTSQRDLFTGINTLDGFSTTAAIISENSATLGALADGTLVAESLEEGTRFEKLSGTAALETEPVVTACLNCAASAPPTATTPQQLQFVPQVPLDERTNYVAALTTDAQGTIRLLDETEVTTDVMAPAAWALLRMESPLADANGKSLIAGVPDANAAALEPNRLRLKPLIDEAVAAGIPRSKMAIASVFRTQSTVTSLTAIANGLTAALSTAPLYLVNTGAAGLAAFGTSLPRSNVAALYQGKLTLANLLTGTGGTFNPNPAQARPELVEFVMTVPNTEMPADGYPVVIFGHGFRSYRNAMLAIADSLAAKGFVTIATDTIYHGERSTCVGSRAATGASTDDAACADPASQRCEASPASPSFGRCVARAGSTVACSPVPTATQPMPGDTFCGRGATLPPAPAGPNLGRCVPTAADFSTGVCEGGSFLPTSATDPRPVISGWNILNTVNLFATRDNFRQQAIDLTQLVRVIKGGEMAEALGDTVKLDTAQIHYAGQSLGGILGTLFTGVNEDVQNVALNVPGTDLPAILLTSPSFVPQRDAFLARLAAGGVTPGTPAFDQFIGLAKWITDPADPQNYAFAATNRTEARKAFIQYIDEDQTIPNPTTEQLIRACNRPGSKEALTFKWEGEAVENMTPAQRHGWLLTFPDPAATLGAQNQVSTFLQTAALP
jgi:hypothetical protein